MDNKKDEIIYDYDYEVVTEWNKKAFEEKIKELLNKGWGFPNGTSFIVILESDYNDQLRPAYYQPMYRMKRRVKGIENAKK